MAIVGRVRELWRYPVKSMAGEALAACEVGTLGIAGDRGWAIRDEQVGEIRGAKKLPGLLRCGARYRSEPSAQTIPAVDITLPDGTRTASDDPEVAARLSHLLGRPVTLWPRRPADDRDHYRRAAPDNPDLEQELRQIFGREPDEPLPDLTNIPPEVFEYAAPPGTYFDVYPFHLVTTATLDALASRAPQSSWDVRRFRPNAVIELAGGSSGLIEAGWGGGRRVRIGSVELRGEIPTARCVMVTLPQGDLPHDPKVLRTVVREAQQCLGLYASVAGGGWIAVGDAVELL
jgi:uncharacterized protein YcbX